MQNIANALHSDGYIVLDCPIADIAQDLHSHLENIDTGQFKSAGIGREQKFQHNPFVRSDEILWIDECEPELTPYMDWMNTLRQQINQNLFLGLFDYECHFAHYSPGSFYKKHIDAFKGSSNRVVTTILYLNPHWQPGDGGELLLYTPDSGTLLKTISPRFGKLVVFLSELFPHEVLPANKDRYSIAGWFRIRE